VISFFILKERKATVFFPFLSFHASFFFLKRDLRFVARLKRGGDPLLKRDERRTRAKSERAGREQQFFSVPFLPKLLLLCCRKARERKERK
tara:strand:- start:424 stop:696 length:273 start_codon:yes stop_codon:yes gene_type:complete